ncbi:RedV protein [Nocardia sp. XZ_19_385]|uniref:RedV protein n=1 Tax=Nocardia sp. XZ_19_385 TaxID=2769488 RepID=UPI001890453F|nr:RedV protein [Nocardia sp. XZ_19_385]
MKAQHARQRVAIPFGQALTAALAVAATSPSSHNCQPWAVARLPSARGLDKGSPVPEFLVLAVDRSREIGALPAHHAEMRVSCGLYWRLLQRALAAQGWVAHRDVSPVDTPSRVLPAEWNPLRLTEFHWTGEQRESLSSLRALAASRQTNRGPYSARPIPTTTLAALSEHLGGTNPPIEVRQLRTEDELDRFADYVKRYGGRDFGHRQAWQETHSFIRRDAAEADARGDGFTFAHLFGPLSPAQQLLRRWVLAPRTMSALRVIGFPRLLAGQLARVVRTAPVVVALSLPESGDLDDNLITAGERLCDYWLHVTRSGLVLHPVSIVVQHEDLRAGLCARFGMTGRPFFIARLGFPTTSFPHTPRRNPDACFREL